MRGGSTVHFSKPEGEMTGIKDGLMFVGVARSTTWRCGRWKALLVRILGKNMGTGMWRYRGVFYLLKECK